MDQNPCGMDVLTIDVHNPLFFITTEVSAAVLHNLLYHFPRSSFTTSCHGFHGILVVATVSLFSPPSLCLLSFSFTFCSILENCITPGRPGVMQAHFSMQGSKVYCIGEGLRTYPLECHATLYCQYIGRNHVHVAHYIANF